MLYHENNQTKHVISESQPYKFHIQFDFFVSFRLWFIWSKKLSKRKHLTKQSDKILLRDWKFTKWDKILIEAPFSRWFPKRNRHRRDKLQFFQHPVYFMAFLRCFYDIFLLAGWSFDLILCKRFPIFLKLWWMLSSMLACIVYMWQNLICPSPRWDLREKPTSNLAIKQSEIEIMR